MGPGRPIWSSARAGFVAPALAHRDHQLSKALLHARRHRGHHAEVEERQTAVVGEQDVARMRIGVEEAVHHDLLEVGTAQLLGQLPGVHLELGERAEGVHLAPADGIPW